MLHSSSVCYAPLNAKYTLVSSLDSMHRFYTDDNIAEGDDSYRISESNSSEKIKLLKTYSGHQNKSFCLKSRVISVESGDYVVSGSEDSKVTFNNYECFFT